MCQTLGGVQSTSPSDIAIKNLTIINFKPILVLLKLQWLSCLADLGNIHFILRGQYFRSVIYASYLILLLKNIVG